MYVAAASRSMPNACAIMKTLLPLLLLLSFYLPAEALRCYDCLSKSVPECSDGSRSKKFDTPTCSPDEIFCSVLLMNDSAGTQIISRQCASREDEGDQLTGFIAGTHEKPLKMVKFLTCKTDLCNTLNPIERSSADSKLHDGGHSSGVTGPGKSGDGGAGARISATLPGVLSMLVVALAASAAMLPDA